MASSMEKLREMELTRDEVDRLGEALKREEFRKLLTDYVEEIQDPENRRTYEREIAQLEQERGMDVTFIHPRPGYVLKTSLDGVRKCFINICVNDLLDRPSSVATIKDGSRGFQWSLPHSISPAREDLDNKKQRCVVYDVVFHPETLQMADKNAAFRSMINTTAMEAVENNYAVQLDKTNVKYPKLQYKGVPRACIRRTPSKNPIVVERTPEEQQFFDNLYKNADIPRAPASPGKKSKRHRKSSSDDKPTATHTIPKYVIKHRSHTDIQDYAEHRDAKLLAAIPKELVVEVHLPLLKSAGDITLDVTEKTVQLLSDTPAKYKLAITLPYGVNEQTGSAKFDKDLKNLIITLPVKCNSNSSSISSSKMGTADVCVEDSGVESDHPGSGDNESEEDAVSDAPRTKQSAFLDSNLFYNLPEFTCHLFEQQLAFTLNVKNVDEHTIERKCTESSVHVKFASISSSFYPSYHSFFVKLDSSIQADDVQIETWDNNVVLQIPFTDAALRSYHYGCDEHHLKERCIEEPSIIAEVLEEDKPLETISEEVPASPVVAEKEQQQQQQQQQQTKAIDIASSYESSGDELSCGSFSPAKSKGILKRLARQAVVRSISESSLDDFVASSFENCHTSLDSVIPEDSEVSTSLKKTVRFNDNIKRQLYRSNSSILGQKKKNQRKSRNKKRANERRHSESELSEVEEQQKPLEGELKTIRKCAGTEDQKPIGSKGSQGDIFHLDMDH